MADHVPPPLDLEDGDLFAVPPPKAPRGPHTSRSAPETSAKAAAAVRPAVPTIREKVEAFARDAGPGGFIDEDLIALAEDERHGDRSFRPRRTELTDANIVLDSGRRRRNANGQECVVWVHRDHVLQPPAVCEVGRPKPDEVRAAFDILDKWARQMKNEGRLFMDELQTAIATLRAATRR